MGIIQKQTLQSTAFSYVGILLGFVTQLFLFPRILTPAQIGLLSLLSGGAVLLAYFANLGINSAAGRYFPYFRDYERGHNGFLRLALGISLLGFLASVGVLLLFRPYVQAFYQQQSALFVEYYYLIIPLTFFQLYFNVFETYARLLYNSVTSTFLQQIGLRFSAMIVVSLYGLGWITFKPFMALWLTTYGLQTLLMVVSVARTEGLPLARRVGTAPVSGRELARYAGLTLAAGLSTQIIMQIDKFMVNDYRGLADAGIYALSSYFGIVIAAPAQALYRASGAVIADSWKTENLDNIQIIYRRSCLNQLIIGSLVYVGIAANLPGVFAFLPPGYSAGYAVVLWICLGKLVDMATGVNGIILQTSRYYAWDSVFFIVLVAATVLLNRWLLPQMGLQGAAVAGMAATILFNFARTAFVWLKFGLQPFTWRNVVVLAIAGAVWAAVAQVPHWTGPLWRVALDVVLRSAAITLLFVGAIYVLRIDLELNRLAKKSLGFMVRSS